MASTSRDKSDIESLSRRLIVATHAVDQMRKSEQKMIMERDQLKEALAQLLPQIQPLG